MIWKFSGLANRAPDKRVLSPAIISLCGREIDMTTYLVRMSGRNFLIEGEGGPRKARFSATRLVEAENTKRAENIALDLLRKDIDLWHSVLNEVSDPPRIYLESVSEVSAAAYDAQKRASALYWEDEGPEE